MKFDSESLLAIDVETSGPNPHQHAILSVALVPVARPDDACCWHVKPSRLVWADIGREYFENYRDEWERNALHPDFAARRIARWLRGQGAAEMMLVGHNVGFDFSFLKQLSPAFPRLSHRSIDTHTLLRALAWMGHIPESACSSTGALEYFQIVVPPDQRHTALGDALAARELFLRLASCYPQPVASANHFSSCASALAPSRSG